MRFDCRILQNHLDLGQINGKYVLTPKRVSFYIKWPIIFQYTIYVEPSNVTYIGVTIDQHLSWNQHIANISKKAKRFPSTKYSQVIEACGKNHSWIYLTCVVSISILKLDMVQRRAARFDFFRYSSVSRILRWPMLKQWRNGCKVILMCKMINNSVFISQKLEYNTNHHPFKLITLSCRINVYHDSFSLLPLFYEKIWLSLPEIWKNCNSYFYNWLCVIFSYQNIYIFPLIEAVH